MIEQEFAESGLSENAFWNGFSLVSAMPGPMFNIAVYVGAYLQGVFGAIVCFVALFLPAFLVIWGILPYWSKYRNNEYVAAIFKGVGATAVGFVFAAIVGLLVK